MHSSIPHFPLGAHNERTSRKSGGKAVGKAVGGDLVGWVGWRRNKNRNRMQRLAAILAKKGARAFSS